MGNPNAHPSHSLTWTCRHIPMKDAGEAKRLSSWRCRCLSAARRCSDFTPRTFGGYDEQWLGMSGDSGKEPKPLQIPPPPPVDLHPPAPERVQSQLQAQKVTSSADTESDAKVGRRRCPPDKARSAVGRSFRYYVCGKVDGDSHPAFRCLKLCQAPNPTGQTKCRIIVTFYLAWLLRAQGLLACNDVCMSTCSMLATCLEDASEP